MAQIKNIGKNTIGDNNKMKVALHDYEMSTHDLSYIWRNTQSPGTLVPFMKILAQKGDIFDIQLMSKTLTHPTVGPLFGAYKIQHFVFNCPIRLYNSWLHNNRLGIGLKMNQIKFPKYRTPRIPMGEKGHSSSSLISYFGMKGIRTKNNTTVDLSAMTNAIPILAYWDIFKNYFANTQELNAYMVTADNIPAGTTEPPQFTILSIDSIEHDYSDNITIEQSASNLSTITLKPNNQDITADQWQRIWKQVTITFGSTTSSTTNQVATLGSAESISKNIVNLSGLPTSTTIKTVQCNTANINTILAESVTEIPGESKTKLVAFPLANIDKMRDIILKTPGNIHLIIGDGETNIAPYQYRNLQELQKPQEGLAVKTYDSDVFMNWVNTDWIDGINGINELSAVSITDGKFTMDTLNMAQKVYNMLNRIAVSGGTYRDWLDTVYTAGSYMERPETPIFEGGMSQIIEFQEVVSTSATADEPLGTLAGRGRAGNQRGSGKLHFRCSEPSYIIGLCAITPLVDYSQGNEWDMYLDTMEDLHKPALDGIGYQDSLNRERAWFGSWFETDTEYINQSPGKTVAWINYMTNFNKTFGNFAAGESEAFMCLNKYYYENETTGGIKNLSTYIDPSEHNEIFADTDINAMNFWVQTAVDMTRRGNYSAKQIPNL